MALDKRRHYAGRYGGDRRLFEAMTTKSEEERLSYFMIRKARSHCLLEDVKLIGSHCVMDLMALPSGKLFL